MKKRTPLTVCASLRLSLICSLFILFHFSSLGQTLSLIFDDFQVDQGDIIQVKVKMPSDQMLKSIQTAIFWDSTALKYVEVIDKKLPAAPIPANFHLKTAGELRTSWAASSGISFLAKSDIFTIVFEVTGNNQVFNFEIKNSLPFFFSTARDNNDTPMEIASAGGEVIINNLLPVELLFFKGETLKNGNYLTWQTASEFSNAGFQIERSQDGKQWEAIDFVKGYDTSLETKDYQFLDQQVEEAINYYRLKQVDFEGAYEYSNVIILESKDGNSDQFKIYPNPVTHIIQYEVENLSSIKSIQVFDLQGKLVKEIRNINGKIEVKNLEAGSYLLLIKTEKEQLQRVIIKQ